MHQLIAMNYKYPKKWQKNLGSHFLKLLKLFSKTNRASYDDLDDNSSSRKILIFPHFPHSTSTPCIFERVFVFELREKGGKGCLPPSTRIKLHPVFSSNLSFSRRGQKDVLPLSFVVCLFVPTLIK